ncbi:hypothetical protein MTR_8g468170 [Medicago truncatula]|uniref:Uncharacterized protein n=1 Tax=Medicago truncatula TaxID=3880 RepID=A0A072TSD4_MEDTR|nr:hypothetical protein MTR_8g468170 [Medicago truncatula]
MGEFMSRQYTTKNSRFSCGFSCDQISTGIPGDIAAFSDEVFCGYSSSRNVRRYIDPNRLDNKDQYDLQLGMKSTCFHLTISIRLL